MIRKRQIRTRGWGVGATHAGCPKSPSTPLPLRPGGATYDRSYVALGGSGLLCRHGLPGVGRGEGAHLRFESQLFLDQ